MKQARAALAGVALSIGLIFGYVAITAYLMSQSIFHQGRLAQAAQKIISNPIVRNDIANAITNNISSSIGNVPLNAASEINVALRSVLATPALQNVFTNTLALAQARLIGNNVGNITIGGASITTPLSQALASVDPALAASIKNSNLSISVPGTALPNLGVINRALPRVEHDALAGALGLIGFALIVSPHRAKVIRKVGFAAVAISFVNAFLFWLVPSYLLPLTGFSWTPVASVILSAVGGPAISTFIALLLTGGALIFVSTMI